MKTILFFTALFSLTTCLHCFSQTCQLYKKIHLEENKKIKETSEHTSFNSFSKMRKSIYQKRGINICNLDSFIIIEGFSPDRGACVGLLIYADKFLYYQLTPPNDLTTTIINSTDSNQISKLPINKRIINDILIWKISTSNIRYHVNKGFSFLAIKVVDNKIDLLLFDEY